MSKEKKLSNRVLENKILEGRIIGKVPPERQIRWNRTEGSQYHHEDLLTRMYFLLINQPQEIKTIQNKIFNFYELVFEKINLFESVIPKSNGLHYLCFTFETTNGIFSPTHEIYSGRDDQDRLKIFYDSKLKIVPEQNEQALFYLQKYVDEKICKIIR